jgi:hypothetical protein
MNDDKNPEALLRWLVVPLLVLVFMAQAYALRGLFADGANFFLDILTKHEMPWWYHQRIFNHLITKSPTRIAVLFGIRDIAALRFLYSSWLLLCPLLVWGACLWNLRRDVLFWPFVTLFCFVYFSTDFFAIGEYNLCFALLAYCFTVLLLPLPKTFLPRAGLLSAALFLSLDYPATLFSGALLALLAFAKPEKEWNTAPRLYRGTLIALFLLSVVSALWEVVAPLFPNNFTGAKNTRILLQDTQFWCALLYAAAVSSMFFVTRFWLRAALTLLCFGLLVWIAIDPFRLSPFPHYGIRAFTSLALVPCGVGLWWFRRYAGKIPDQPSVALPPALLGALLLVMLSYFDIGMSLDYAQYLEAFQREVNSKAGLISYEQSALPMLIDNDRFNWGWTNSLMSVVLRDNARKAIILNPAGYQGYQPFDPLKNVPDLSAYYAK